MRELRKLSLLSSQIPYFCSSYQQHFYRSDDIYGVFSNLSLDQIVKLTTSPFGSFIQSCHFWQWPPLDCDVNDFIVDLLSLYHSEGITAAYNRILSFNPSIDEFKNVSVIKDPRNWHIIQNVIEWECTGSSLKSSLRSFAKSGGYIRLASSSDAISIANLYAHMSQKKSFSSLYSVDLSFFEKIISSTAHYVFTAFDCANILQGFSVFSQHSSRIDYSFAGSSRQLPGCSAALICAMIDLMKENNDSRPIHLGGGIKP